MSPGQQSLYWYFYPCFTLFEVHIQIIAEDMIVDVGYGVVELQEFLENVGFNSLKVCS